MTPVRSPPSSAILEDPSTKLLLGQPWSWRVLEATTSPPKSTLPFSSPIQATTRPSSFLDVALCLSADRWDVPEAPLPDLVCEKRSQAYSSEPSPYSWGLVGETLKETPGGAASVSLCLRAPPRTPDWCVSRQ